MGRRAHPTQAQAGRLCHRFIATFQKKPWAASYAPFMAATGHPIRTVVASGKKFGSPWNRCFKKDTKCRFVILSEAQDLVFLRFFGRFAPSE
jgi:hypothetical protein